MSEQLPTGQVHAGDCIELMHSWPADSVDLIFADPPYNIGYRYDVRDRPPSAANPNQGRGTEYDDSRPDAEYIQWTEDWISACARLLKPSGSLYILIGDEYAAEARVHLKKLERAGELAFRNWIIWHYTFGQNCRAKFNRSHAHLFYCVGSAALRPRRRKGRKRKGETDADRIVSYEQDVDVKDPPFTFNREAVAIPSARQTTYADARANPTGKLPDDTWYLRPQDVDKEGLERYFHPEEDTWYLSRLAGTFSERLGWHPTQLPEALLERIIKLSSNESDVVFDPFVGSGTTLAVAARLGRRWLGCELSEDYAKRAMERVEYAERTGERLSTTMAEKGIKWGKPNTKKQEPDRSPHLRKKSRSA